MIRQTNTLQKGGLCRVHTNHVGSSNAEAFAIQFDLFDGNSAVWLYMALNLKRHPPGDLLRGSLGSTDIIRPTIANDQKGCREAGVIIISSISSHTVSRVCCSKSVILIVTSVLFYRLYKINSWSYFSVHVTFVYSLLFCCITVHLGNEQSKYKGGTKTV